MSLPRPAPAPRGFTAVVPVKPPARGKSRLAGLPDDVRRELAGAFALDTVTAALTAPTVRQVLAVTDDFRFAARLSAAGCAVLPDGAAGDLNATLAQAAAEAVRRWPEEIPVALCADLPALRPGELEAFLAAWDGARPAFVPDLAGEGTTAYVAAVADFAPRFGERSRAEHLAAGAVELAGDWPTLRQDVDDVDDLGRAQTLGLGRHTSRAWAGRRD